MQSLLTGTTWNIEGGIIQTCTLYLNLISIIAHELTNKQCILNGKPLQTSNRTKSIQAVFWVVACLVFWLYTSASKEVTAPIFKAKYENRGSMFLRNVGTQPKENTEQEPRIDIAVKPQILQEHKLTAAQQNAYIGRPSRSPIRFLLCWNIISV
jgi:hypothetical protein